MRQLSCPEARALVSDYIDGELDSPIARALENHLQTCPNCPPLYASLVETLTDLRRLGDEGDVEKVVGVVVAALSRRGHGAGLSPYDIDLRRG